MGSGKDRDGGEKACSEPKPRVDIGQSGQPQNTRRPYDTDSYHQRLLDGVLSNLLDGIITIDDGGIVLSVNPAIEQMTGYSAAELLGHNITILMGKHVAKQHHAYLQRFLEKGENGIVDTKRYLQVYRKDGSFFEAEIAVSKMLLDGDIVFIGSVYDVTEKIEQEKKLWELARFPEENSYPVMKITAEGIICYANSNCDPVFQIWQTEMDGQVPVHIKNMVQQCIADGQSQQIEVDCNCETDCETGQCFSLSFAPVPDLKAAYVYGLDISQSKRDQKELLVHRTMLEEMVKTRTEEAVTARHEAERANQAKSLFLANMSHEIRTPLTSIIGYAESLLEDKPDEAELTESVKTIIRSGQHLKGIIDNILDLSKIEAEKLEIETLSADIVGIMAEIQSMMNPLAIDRGITFNITYQYPVPKNITTDPIRFKQILLNLCSNAIKFTKQGGVEIRVSCKQDGKSLVVGVVDTGIGLTAEQIGRVFKPFVQADVSTTREYGGTGLGLSLSRRLSEILGGQLDLQSERGKGSCFILTLPMTDQDEAVLLTEPEQQKIAQQQAEQSVLQGQLQGRVLLAEDTPELQLLISRYIRKTGLEVDVADNGELAVKAALAGDYDLVFMDIQMPVMDGYTAVKSLRAKGYAAPIVAMTANAMQEDRQRCLAAGCDDFVAKPVQREHLYNVLARYSTVAASEQAISLVSTLYETDPDIAELVETFLGVLPGYIDQCQSALAVKNWEALNYALHVLKGMGGSYGYKIITETAAEAEQRLKLGDYAGLKPLVEKLEQLNAQAQRGYKQQTG